MLSASSGSSNRFVLCGCSLGFYWSEFGELSPGVVSFQRKFLKFVENFRPPAGFLWPRPPPLTDVRCLTSFLFRTKLIACSTEITGNRLIHGEIVPGSHGLGLSCLRASRRRTEMASAHSATLCSPDVLLHVRDLLHWQTLRCFSGLGLLHPENSVVSRPALQRSPVFVSLG